MFLIQSGFGLSVGGISGEYNHLKNLIKCTAFRLYVPID